MTSRIPGFYRLPPEQRLSTLESRTELGESDRSSFGKDALDLDVADLMIENVIGTFALPLGVGINFQINGNDVLVPMVVEEPSVVAAVSNMAKLARGAGGFSAQTDSSVMIGQVQLMPTENADETAAQLEAALPMLMEKGAGVHPRLEARGGGLRGMEVRKVVYDEPGEAPETMVVLHFFLDCVDAMGANMVNTLAETLAPYIRQVTGAKIGLRILSNLADRRIARAEVRLPPELLDQQDIPGREVAERIASAYRFAYADPHRAATHNKGIMNGIDAVALATGNDWRAIEAGAHAYAARTGQYRSLTRWTIDSNGHLHGRIEVPIQVGVVGGPIRVHPTVRSNLKLLNITRASELAEVMAAVGLAQNLGALRALATEGIQQGHMRMHARSVAATAGALPEEVPAVASALCAEGDFSIETAKRVLRELKKS
ncbi:MAG: hydroxymethylglutaryl-CoA reductase, degradative [Myxococcota bacterium]|nr:hydroxymethylglutaryl-CoA reductase, degradative [Myxococcota bacterium]